MSTALVDLTHPLRDGLLTHPGLPGPAHTVFRSRQDYPAYAERAPYLTAAGAEWLAAHRPALVGIDAVNIDDLDDPARPAHSKLLRVGVLVLEHLTNLAAVGDRTSRLHAAPLPWRGVGTWPVRAYVVTGDRLGRRRQLDRGAPATGRLRGRAHGAWPSVALNAVWLGIAAATWRPTLSTASPPPGSRSAAGTYRAEWRRPGGIVDRDVQCPGLPQLLMVSSRGKSISGRREACSGRRRRSMFGRSSER